MDAGDAVRRALEAGSSFEELVALTRPPAATQHLIERAALVRSFDRALYGEVLARDVDGAPPFDLFVRSPDIEPVPYLSARFWVREEARGACLDRWRTDPEGLRGWSARLAEHLAGEGGELSLEVLEHRLRADPEAAAALFDRVYRSSDHGFDLARCHALLELAERLKTGSGSGSALDRIRQGYLALYRARSLFADDFRQTVRYVHRPSVERRLRRALARGSPRWIVNLHGSGGTGKTTILRRQVAHRLVTRRLRVPCARIDFDTVSLSAVCDFPWLLALPIAEQLDRQVVAPLFTSLLLRLQPLRALVSGRQMEVDDELLLRARAGQAAWVWPVLLDGFRSLPADRPIVIIVDTLEEASLHRPEQLLTIVRRLAELHAAVPSTRLVLAGRYALGLEHVPEYRGEFLAETRHIRLHRFRDAAARRFVRGLLPELSADRVQAIVRRGEGSPFRLALLAELVEDDPSITAARILGPEFDHVDEAYLMDRVIRRIPLQLDARPGAAEGDQLPVRWVIRYGVVPRRLSREFVERVLLPFLREALSGDAELAGDDFVAQYKRDWPSFASPDRSFDVARVWEQLASYATSGRHGWVSIDRGDEPTLRFHPDVVTPMRRLLRAQPVHVRIQRAAREFFAARGAAEDVLFHDLQLHPSQAFATWRAVFEQCGDDWAARARLADALLQPDFAAAPAAALGLAHWEAANAMSAAVNYTFALPTLTFDRASRHLAEASRLEAQSGERIVPGWCHTAAEAMQRFRTGAAADATAMLAHEIAHGGHGARAQVRLLLQLAELRVRMGEEANRDFERALEAARGDEAREVPLWAIHDRLAHRAARQGRWPDAAAHYEGALEDAQALGRLDKYREFTNRLVLVDLSEGRAARALERLSRAERLGPNAEPRDPHFFEAHARVALALKYPEVAIDFASLLQRMRTGQERDALEAHFLLGEAYAEQLELARALDAYRRGKQGFAARGELPAADRCRVAMLRLFVRQAGNVREAAMLLDEGPLASAEQSPTLHAEWTVLAAWVACRTGRTQEAAAALAALARPDLAGQSPHQQIVAWTASLALGLVELDAALLRRLLDAAAQVQPDTARVSLLEPLELGGTWRVAGGADAGLLLPAFTAGGDGTATATARREARLRALAAAELARAIGQPDRAWEILGPDDEIRGFRDLVLLRHRLALEMRLRAAGAPGPRLDARVDLEPAAWTPMLQAALRLGLGERLLACDAPDEARAVCRPVLDLLRESPIPTAFHLHAQALSAVEATAVRKDVTEVVDVESEASAGIRTLARELGYTGESSSGAIHVSHSHVTVAGVRVRRRASTVRAHPPNLAVDGPAEGRPLLVAVASAGGRTLVSAADGTWLPAPPALAARLVSHEDHWREAARLAADWPGYVRRLAETLAPVLPSPGAAGPRAWLDLAPPLAALPWEAAAAPGGPLAHPPLRVHWRQDGVPFSQQSEALELPSGEEIRRRRAAARTRPQQVEVLVIDAVKESAFERMTGLAFESLPHQLRADGARVTVVPSLRRGLDALATLSPHLVIVGAMTGELSEGFALLSGGDRIEAGRLHEALVRGQDRLPTLVLDVPAPGSPTEAAVQLLARNRIAEEIFRRGRLHALLAMGLGDEPAMERAYAVLRRAVAERLGVEEVLDALAGAATPDPGSTPDLAAILPFAGAALLAADPGALFLAS